MEWAFGVDRVAGSRSIDRSLAKSKKLYCSECHFDIPIKYYIEIPLNIKYCNFHDYAKIDSFVHAHNVAKMIRFYLLQFDILIPSIFRMQHSNI